VWLLPNGGSGGGNGVDNACDASGRLCGCSGACACDNDDVEHLPSVHPLSE